MFETIELKKILIVNDDELLRQSYAHGLRKFCQVITTDARQHAVDILQQQAADIAVIMFDLADTDAENTAFFDACQQHAPESVRLALAETTEAPTLLQAINDGHIFRSIFKPCKPKRMQNALVDCIKQYDMIQTEKHILGQAILSTVEICVDFLTIIHPLVYSFVSRLKKHMDQICDHLKIQNRWRFAVAILLSHLGCALLDKNTITQIMRTGKLSNSDRLFYQDMLRLSSSMIKKIPRMEVVTTIILDHPKPLYQLANHVPVRIQDCNIKIVGCQLLKVVVEFNRNLTQGFSCAQIVERMREYPNVFHKDIVNALPEIDLSVQNKFKAKVRIEDLKTNMTTSDTVHDKQNDLVLDAEQPLTETIIAQLIDKKRQREIEPWIDVYIDEALAGYDWIKKTDKKPD